MDKYSDGQLFNFIRGGSVTGESTYDLWKSLGYEGDEAAFLEFMKSINVVDTLDSNSVNEALSANQGRLLNERVSAIEENGVNSDSIDNHIADTNIHVTASEKQAWNAKSNFSGNYNDLSGKPTIPTVPTKVSAFTNDANYVTSDVTDQLSEQIIYVTPEMFDAKGDGVTDDTKAWEDAVATGKKIICGKNKTYLITSVGFAENDKAGNAHLLLSTGQSIDFNGSTVLWKHPTGTYRCLFVAQNVSNIEISNGVIIGDRETNATEFLHPICLVSSNNICISNMTIKETGGDGIVITEYLTSEVPCKNIEIANCHIYHAYRNALSIIMADGVEVHGCKFEYTYGTSPHAGIDIEPNRYYQYTKNIKIHHCSFLSNNNRGFLVTCHNNPAEIGVELDSCYFESNGIVDVALSTGSTAGVVTDTIGYIDIKNCVAKYAGTNSIWINGHTSGKVRITFDDFTINECNQKGKTAIVSGACVYVKGYAEDDVAQNIHLNNIHIIGNTQTKDLYAYYADIEYTGDFIDGAVIFCSADNAKLKALSNPVRLEDTLSLNSFPMMLYPSYVKPSDSTKDSTVNIGSLPSKLDIEFINCSDYNINIVYGQKTYILPANTRGMWISEQHKVIGVKPTYTADEVGARPNTWTPSKSDVGLANVDNVKQYSADNPPPYPVESVNGKTGKVTINVPTSLSGLNNDIYNLVDVVATYEDGTTETLQLLVKK